MLTYVVAKRIDENKIDELFPLVGEKENKPIKT